MPSGRKQAAVYLESHTQTLIIYTLGFRQNHYTFAFSLVNFLGLSLWMKSVSG